MVPQNIHIPQVFLEDPDPPAEDTTKFQSSFFTAINKDQKVLCQKHLKFLIFKVYTGLGRKMTGKESV